MLALSALCLLAGRRACCDENDHRPKETRPTVPAAGAADRPVILLTGFEPFGEGRPLNPSWEGVAPLDGKAWKEYRLVSKQVRVVWGAPRRQLEEWIAAYRPVAIFSFGQGGANSFALESKASNRRGHIPDNEGGLPSPSLIVEDGPDVFYSSLDFVKLSQSLTKKGYPLRVSTRAGHYLCEEMLYTLEYLKTRHKLESVSFFHVPPLGSGLGGKPVTAEYVGQFVKDVLEAWHTVYHEGNRSAPAGGSHE